MKTPQYPNVAVLLATYNGGRYIKSQIKSLKENDTRFTLHWIDDHSSDNTREAVRATVATEHIALSEWHDTHHQGIPRTFFHLLESVEADIYLFCDQDDIWQPGKIDATVANLLPDVATAALCFSDPLMFNDDAPGRLRRLSEFSAGIVHEDSRMFLPGFAAGHTQGFTRPLREMYLGHKVIARTYAFMHDVWMYNIAVASGTIRVLHNVPTTLWRRHENTFGASFTTKGQKWIYRNLGIHQRLRRLLASNAQGFILASASLPAGPKLDRLLEIARIMATIDRRQSPVSLLRLAHRRAFYPSWRNAAWCVAACLCSDANPDPAPPSETDTRTGAR